MALSPHDDPIWSSNQVAQAIIDNGNHESYLLATLQLSEL